MVRGQSRQKESGTQSQKKNTQQTKRAQVVEYLLSKPEALSSNSSTEKKK
jgi:hypothetical protein